MKFLRKYEFGVLFIYILPIALGFSNITFFIALLIVGLFFIFKKQLYLFFLILFIYKYASGSLLLADKSSLNALTTIFSFFYCFFFFRNFKKVIENSGAVPFLLFGLFTLVCSANSIIPALSLAKSLGFLVSGMALYYIVFSYFKDIVQFLTRLFSLLVLTSFLIPRDIGMYNSTLGLHSGILGQSQAYGWLLTLCFPFFLIRAKVNKFDFFHTVLILGGIFYLYNTHMRSAYIAFFCIFIMVCFFDDLVKFFRPQLFLFFIILMGVFFSAGRIELLAQILDKRGAEVEGLNGIDEMVGSRSKKASPSLANFYTNPILGIGYGLPTESTNKLYNYKEHWGIVYFPGTDFIISFPVEKGVLYTSILEELGVIGFVLFLNLILRGTRMIEHRFLLLLPVLVLSLGEASLFSLNGIGVFGFVVLAVCTVKNRCNWDELMIIR